MKTAKVAQFKSRAALLWDSYVRAAQKAVKTKRLEDGLAAKRAYGRFLNDQSSADAVEKAK